MKIIMEPSDLGTLMHAAADEVLCDLGEWDDDNNFVIAARTLTDKQWGELIKGAIHRAAREEMYGFSSLLGAKNDPPEVARFD